MIPTIDANIKPGNEGLRVRFFNNAVEHKVKTLEQGRVVHVSKVFIEKANVGSNEPFVREKRKSDEFEFPAEWAAFEKGEDPEINGTRLSDWGQLPVETIADLKAINLLTVEDLASLSDMKLQQLGLGGLKLRVRARAYLKAAEDKGLPARLAVAVKKLQDDLKIANEKLTLQAKKIRTLEAEAK